MRRGVAGAVRWREDSASRDGSCDPERHALDDPVPQLSRGALRVARPGEPGVQERGLDRR
eukprot:14763002-Heterocapsa_arctica.AAC.1